jgi:Xaa-Pro dipeptidase
MVLMKSTKRTWRELPGFSRGEFETRVERARTLMTEERLDGVVVCSEPNLEYLSGFVTQFAWNTPTRPWYFVLPRKGDALAVIPEIGDANWLKTSWCRNLLTWPSPRPDNEGIDLLVGVIKKVKRRFGRIGFELGPETRIGTTVSDLLRIRDEIAPMEMCDCQPVMRELRMVKSAAEIAYVRRACLIASDGFDLLPSLLHLGDSEREIVRAFGAQSLRLGADKVPFIAIGSGRGGYSSVIIGPTTRRIDRGDILNIDTGIRYGGYSSDFNRNFAIGRAPMERAARLYDILWRTTEAGIKAAVPGNTAEGLFFAQAKVLEGEGLRPGNVGRFGHGLGKVLTEYPSNKPGDRTLLRAGMVITIEPSAMFAPGKTMVHEEDLVITEDRPVLLSRRAPRQMPVVEL